jgi:hypothetical protein
VPETDDTTTTDESTGQTGASTRRRPPGADPEVRSFGRSRICAAEGCQTRLSRYNPDEYCSVHRGWDRQVITRKRRNDGEAAR